jgi:hypothetical protein
MSWFRQLISRNRERARHDEDCSSHRVSYVFINRLYVCMNHLYVFMNHLYV